MKKILLTTIVLFALSGISYAQDVNHPDNVTIQGNLGVGLSGPLSHKLEVDGDINTTGSYRIGGAKLFSILENSIFLGHSAGNTSMTGDYNLFIGRHTGGLNTTGGYNTFIGQNAGQVNTSGGSNTFVGYQAGQFLGGSGSGNTFIGTNSGRSTSGADGSNNTFIGYQTGYNNTSGSKNIFIGYQTGQNNTTASDNISIGYKAGLTHTSNDGNIFIGTTAGEGNSSGLNNVMLGKSAGKTNNGEGNVFLGYQAGYSESGNNKLYIANSYNADPLLYGQFDNKKVGINVDQSTIDANSATLTVGGEVKANDYLLSDGSSLLSSLGLWRENTVVKTEGTTTTNKVLSYSGKNNIVVIGNTEHSGSYGDNNTNAILELQSPTGAFIKLDGKDDPNDAMFINHSSFGSRINTSSEFAIRVNDPFVDRLTIKENGQVGIGTSAIRGGYKMSVKGGILTSNGTDNGFISFRNDRDDIRIYESGLNLYTEAVDGITLDYNSNNDETGAFKIVAGGNSRFQITKEGKIGIGTTDADLIGDRKMYVKGAFIAEQVEVKLATSWADYVFEKDYELKSLEKVEKYINKNMHLPDVPSAQEVKENGFNMAKMDATLLQKIEELTLYVIEQNKQNKKQSEQITKLVSEVEKLKKENKELKGN